MAKEYKEEGEILLEYRTRYYFISCAIEILIHKLYFEKKDWIDGKEISAIFFGRFSNFDTEWNMTKAQVELNLLFMNWMGLLDVKKGKDNNTLYALTEDGKHAYKTQSFHNTAANLYYAKQSRKFAKWAFIIAILSMLITLIALIVDICKC